MQPLSQALLTGDYRLVNADTLELFARTGLIHLLSASGFHMGVAYTLGLTCGWLMPFAWRRPPYIGAAEFCASLFVMALLGAAAGWSKPVVRAFALQLLWLGAKALGLQPRLWWIFAFSLTVSFSLGQGSFISFFLSALSMFAVIATRERGSLYLLFAPWLITMPVTVFFFHSASLFAPVYNLIFAPLFGAFMVLPLILGLLMNALQLSSAARSLSSVADFCGEILLKSLGAFERALGGGVSVSYDAFFLFLGFILIYLFMQRKALWFLLVSILYFIIPQTFSAVFLDVGQGDAVVLKSEGKTLLMDTGRRDGRVLRALARENIAKLDHLFITHPDADHTGGVAKVLARAAIGTAWISQEHLAYEKIFPVLEELERHGVPVHFWTGESPLPGLQCAAGPGGNSNDTSPLCRFRLRSGERLLLTGDLSGRAEEWFVREHPEFFPAEVLKVSHHGSRGSTADAFLRRVRPKVAVISAGRKNRYGHPHKDVLTKLIAEKISVVRTEDGAIKFY